MNTLSQPDGQKKNLGFAIFAVVALVILRLALAWTTLGYESVDYTNYLSEWFDTIQQNGGADALGQQVGNYGIPYQTLIALMTYLPLSALSCYKLLSMGFDFLLVLACGAMAWYLLDGRAREERLVGTAAACLIAMFLPTVFLNSSLWAQCDSIYTTFVMLALLCLCKEHDAGAYILLGIALSFKLQTAYILPVFLFVAYIRRHLRYLVLTLAAWYAACIPGFLAGRSLLSPFEIYLGQAEDNPKMYRNFTNIWTLIGNDYSTIGDMAIVYTVTILAIIMLYLLYRYHRDTAWMSPVRILEIACLLTWTCVILLPNMHERYSYPVEIMLLVLICVHHRYLPCLIIEEAVILQRYGRVLFDDKPITDAETLLYLGAYALFVYLMFRQGRAGDSTG